MNQDLFGQNSADFLFKIPCSAMDCGNLVSFEEGTIFIMLQYEINDMAIPPQNRRVKEINEKHKGYMDKTKCITFQFCVTTWYSMFVKGI